MSQKLLRLLQLTSPTLPIGAYAYSQGAESAVHAKIVVDDETAFTWIKEVLLSSLVYGDLALLANFYQAWLKLDQKQLKMLTQLSIAIRETAELRQEDLHIAKALIRLAEPLKVDFPQAFVAEPTYPLVFSCFAVQWELTLEEMLTAFAWSWMETQVAAMIKLVPLGQTQGQKMILKMDEVILQAVTQAQTVGYDAIGKSLPMLAILSARHEIQYSRLFRS